MRKVNEILRLHFEQKLGQRQIARSANVSQSTVHDYLARAKAADLAWPLGEEWDETRLQAALFPPAQTPAKPPDRPLPDFASLREQRQQHRELTLELLWEEYRQQHPDGYCYSRFCNLYRRWKKRQDVVLRQEHRAGEKLFLDWAGATIPIRFSGTAIPPFAALSANYPSGTDARVRQRIGGRVNAAWIDHTCAVRLSRALNYSGVAVPASFAGMKVVRGGDGKYYAFQVRGMRPWLEATFGRPQIRAVRPVDRRLFLGKKGVIAFVIPFSDASGHVDLWDGSRYTYEQGDQRDPRDYFTMANEVVLWVSQ